MKEVRSDHAGKRTRPPFAERCHARRAPKRRAERTVHRGAACRAEQSFVRGASFGSAPRQHRHRRRGGGGPRVLRDEGMFFNALAATLEATRSGGDDARARRGAGSTCRSRTIRGATSCASMTAARLSHPNRSSRGYAASRGSRSGRSGTARSADHDAPRDRPGRRADALQGSLGRAREGAVGQGRGSWGPSEVQIDISSHRGYAGVPAGELRGARHGDTAPSRPSRLGVRPETLQFLVGGSPSSWGRAGGRVHAARGRALGHPPRRGPRALARRTPPAHVSLRAMPPGTLSLRATQGAPEDVEPLRPYGTSVGARRAHPAPAAWTLPPALRW